MSNTIGKNIRAAREKAGMTQDELAKKLGYKTRSSIAKIESGENDIPQSKIVSIANALNTTPGALMGWNREPDALDSKVLELYPNFNPKNGYISNINNFNIDETLQQFETASYSKSDKMQIVFVFSPNTPNCVREAIREKFIKMHTTDELSADELELINRYKNLNDDGKSFIRDTAETAAHMNKYKKSDTDDVTG